MRQGEIINQLKVNIYNFSNIEAILLIGSFGRNNAVYNSDIDVSIIVKPNFNVEEFIKTLRRIFSNNIKYILKVDLRKKYVLYFTDSPKLEFNVCNNISEIDKYFLGSEINSVENCILIDRKNRLKRHLGKIIKEKNEKPVDIAALYRNTVDKFIYDFENLSHLHKRSEAYKSYFQYNLALNDCFQLLQLNSNDIKYLYLPQIQSYFAGKEGREKLRSMNGTLYLPEVNKQKRNLLNLFYEIMEHQSFLDKNQVLKLKGLCEWIFTRDYSYNFRDASDNCAKLKPGLLFRTSTLTRYQNDEYFLNILDKYSINKIIDLRAEREIVKDPYKIPTKKVKIVWAPFDPWNQSEQFITNHTKGSDSEIAYRFFALECKASIKKIAEEIIKQKNNAIAVHCHAGKDRTGCLIALFYLLVGASENELLEDYFASESDTKEYKINTFLSEIRKYSSIEDYFISCGLSTRDVQKLKTKISAQ